MGVHAKQAQQPRQALHVEVLQPRQLLGHEPLRHAPGGQIRLLSRKPAGFPKLPNWRFRVAKCGNWLRKEKQHLVAVDPSAESLTFCGPNSWQTQCFNQANQIPSLPLTWHPRGPCKKLIFQVPSHRCQWEGRVAIGPSSPGALFLMPGR